MLNLDVEISCFKVVRVSWSCSISAFKAFTVSLRNVISTCESSHTCIPILLRSGAFCLSLSVSDNGSGSVLDFGGFLGLAGAVWLLVGKFCVGHLSGRNLRYAAERKLSLLTRVLLFRCKFIRPVLCTQIFSKRSLVSGKPKDDRCAFLIDRFEHPGTQQTCTIAQYYYK